MGSRRRERCLRGPGGSTDFPQVQGWDFAGETDDGQRVLGFVTQPWMGVGAFAERIAVPSAILTPLPDSLGFPDGSALPVSVLTARMLVDAAAIGDDQVVLVTGAAGMVGGFAMQLARTRGARVIAAVREPDEDEARRLGAEMVVGTEASSRRSFVNRAASTRVSIPSGWVPVAWYAFGMAGHSSRRSLRQCLTPLGGLRLRPCRCSRTPTHWRSW